jgi:putative ABC transport system permease protein
VTTKLVVENLKNKPMRSLLSFLLIGVPVTLILTLVGLAHGMLQDSENRARGVGADIVVRGSNTSATLSLSGSSVPESYIRYFRTEVPHVKLAMGVINDAIDFPLFVTGIDMDEFNSMTGGFTYLAGQHGLRNPDDILVDELYARQRKLQVGQTISLKNHDWHLVGIIQGGKLARLVVPLKTLQLLDGSEGKISQIYLKLDDPANTDAVVSYITEHNSLKVLTMAEITAMYSVNNVSGLAEFIDVIMGIGVVIGFAVVCLSMYMAVLQRTREIGILKALGGSNSFILGTILAEALVLGIGGTVLGILMSFGSWWLIRTLVPSSLQMIIVPTWWPIAGGITLIGAGLGALYPGLSAARHDPIEALAYE